MNNNTKVFFWSLAAALGGFLFGFDTAVISGCEQTLQALFQSGTLEHGLTVSIALIGTVIGSIYGGIPADKFGRKYSLLIVAVLYFVSAMGSALAWDWYSFLIFRFIGGFGVGISSVVAPMYISEIAPPSRRGRLVALFQFNIVFGILIAYLSNYLIGNTEANSWRWMLGVEAFPAAIFIFIIFFIPESPRWLIIKKNAIDKARAILNVVDAEESEMVISQILSKGTDKVKKTFMDLFQHKYSKPIGLAFFIAFFNQVSGINAIIYYAPRIFEMAGLGADASLLSSAGIGLVNLLATLLGLSLIDKFGRRSLMLVGSVGLIIALGLVSKAFYTNELGGMIVPTLLFLFIAFFAMSQGAVIWVFISEVFPNEVRAYGQAFGSFTHWFMAALISFTFPFIAETFGGGFTFAFFAVMMLVQLIWVWKVMPETKGTSLEEV